jgi:iron complex transport system substrate-binding protein
MSIEIMKRWGLLAFVLVMAAAIIAGCGGNPAMQKTDDSVRQNAETGSAQAKKDNSAEVKDDSKNTAKSGFPVTITDDAGNEVTIEKEPQKIVSIQASITEISFALGLGDKIIGVSDYCNYPEEAKAKEKIGARDINAEKILQLLPDLVLVTDYHHKKHANILDQFRKVGMKVVVIGSAKSFADAYSHMQLIGKATGTEDKANEIVVDIQNRLEAMKEKSQKITEPKKVWIEVSPAPDIFTTGKGTFLHEMLEAINAVNVAGNQEGWIKFTEEEIVNLMPEVIITTYGYYVDMPSEGVLKRAGWQGVPAVKNKQIFDVNNDTVTRPGPRLIDGVETLAKFIYPETFK